MTTFAVTNSDQLLPAVNYLLSNLDTTGTGNVTIPGNVLVANTTTGVVSQQGNASVFGYLYQYVNLRYSNNATGTAGFDTNSNNYSYFGVYNSSNPTPSANPSAYQWYEVDPPFDSASSRTLYYSAIGGRQIQWAAASSPPNSGYQVTVANVAIDLDVVTTATGTSGERGPLGMAYVITTANPGNASSSTLTGWFEASRTANTPPIGTGLTPPVAGDTAYFTYPTTGQSSTFSYNGSVWNSVVGQVVSGDTLVANSVPGSSLANDTITAGKIANATITGDKISGNTITGNLIAGNTITANNIAVSTITGDRIAANTIAGTNIVGNTITGDLIFGNTITGDKIAAATITGSLIQGNTITGNLIAANTIVGSKIQAGTITSNNIAANTITANNISSSYIYAGNIVSFTANIGNINSTGYWLDYNSGDARFGGNVNIGNNLTIGSNASIGGNLAVSGLISSGNLLANTVSTTTIVDGAVSDYVDFQSNTFFAVATGTSLLNNVWYDATFGNLSVTTTQTNQSVFLWYQQQFVYSYNGNGTPGTTNFVTLSAEIIRQSSTGNVVTISSFQTQGTFNAVVSGQSATVVALPVPGIVDVIPTAGTYTYRYRMRTNNTTVPRNINFTRYDVYPSTSTSGTLAPITLLGLVLKR